MTSPGLPVGEDDLTAFVDGRLPPERLDAVEAYLADRPDYADRVDADRRIRAALRERLAAEGSEPIPTRLRVAAIRAGRRRALASRVAGIAAALLLFAGGVGSGWIGRALLDPPDRPRPGEIGREALAAHRTFAPEQVHPVEVKAAEEAHLTQWLSKRLGRRLVIPDLEADGLSLVGGRLLPAGRDVAAQLMYVGAGGARLTLYVRCGEAGTASFSTMREADLSTVYWIAGGTGYAISGPMDRDRLLKVAQEVSRDLDRAAPIPPPL